MAASRLTFVWSLVVAALCIAAGSAAADPWFPHPANATWTYVWSDSQYNPQGTSESYDVESQAYTNGCGWNLAWTGSDQVPLAGSTTDISQPDDGTVCFQDGTLGLENTDWSASQPPISEPSLCADSANCPDSLGSSLFNVIWGARNPVLSEPLLQGITWNATGGGNGNVTSSNQMLGLQLVKVPAFPGGILAAVVRSQIALGGTPGDDFGSGIRTTWWGYGVGPVKVVFDHVNGAVTTVTLGATNLKPQPAPPVSNYFPMNLGSTSTYRWTNSRYMRQSETEKVKVAAVANRSARISVTSVSGPIRAQGNYIFADRTNGLTNTFASSSAATLLKFPRLARGRHFFNPFDLMVYGFGPVLPAYGIVGSSWKSGNAYDYSVYGVTGTTTATRVQRVKVPAGSFDALVVRSVLRQKGFAYGSGVRTMWFAPGRGLVKLTFAHRGGGGVDTVVLVK